QNSGAGVVDAVGDEHLVAGVVVVFERPARCEAVLLVAKEVLDVEQPALRVSVDGCDPPGLALADEVRQDGPEENGLVFHAGQPEVALEAPGPGGRLAHPVHQLEGGDAVGVAHAETSATEAGEEAAVPTNDRGVGRERKAEPVRGRYRLGGELPG